MPKLRISAGLQATIQVLDDDPGSRTWNFYKPNVSAEFEWDEVPDAKEIVQAWEKLWTDHVGPQCEQLIDVMLSEHEKQKSRVTASSSQRAPEELDKQRQELLQKPVSVQTNDYSEGYD